MLENFERPKYLYKYCSANRAKQIINDLYLYLTPINLLNDLYEFAFQALFEEKNDTHIRYMTKNIIASGTGLNMAEAASIAKKSDPVDLKNSFNCWKQRVSDFLSEVRSHSGVTCFSSEPNNQRMWGTYGDNHKGVCIEFRVESDNSPFNGMLVPVMYTNKKIGLCYSDLMNDDGSISNEILIFLSSIKHTHWRDEKEWRALFLANSPQTEEERKFRIRCSDISRIFFGPLISEKDETEINDLLSRKPVNIGRYKRVVDGMFGKEHLEGFELPQSFNDIKYWVEREVNK